MWGLPPHHKSYLGFPGGVHVPHTHRSKKNQNKKIFIIRMIITTFVLINYIMETTTFQKLAKSTKDNLHLAQQYYAIISALNNLSLTEREVQLVAFTAVKGSISFARVREEFCTTYNSSFPTINNMVSKLKKSFILIKQGKQIVVNPRIALDFSKPLVLHITLTINDNTNGETTEHATERVSGKEVESEVERV